MMSAEKVEVKSFPFLQIYCVRLTIICNALNKRVKFGGIAIPSFKLSFWKKQEKQGGY